MFLVPVPHLWLILLYPLGNSFLPCLEWVSKKPPLHVHSGKIQPKHSGAGLQTLCATGGRRRADLPAKLHCIRGKTLLSVSEIRAENGLQGGERVVYECYLNTGDAGSCEKLSTGPIW